MIDLFTEDYSDFVELSSKEFRNVFIDHYDQLYPLISDYVYLKNYIKDPIFYMLILNNESDDKKDNGTFYIPKYINRTSKEYKDADLYLNKCDLRVVSDRLGWCLNEIFSSESYCTESNINCSISGCLWNNSLVSEQLIRIYIDSMFNHRRLILNYIIKNFPELYQFILQKAENNTDNLIYDNHLFCNLSLILSNDLMKKIHIQFLMLCDRFKESITQMRKEFISLLESNVIKYYLSNEKLDDVDEIRLYGTPNLSNTEYEYQIDPSNYYDYCKSLNELWCFYNKWGSYSQVISDMISIKKYSDYIYSKYDKRKFIEFVRKNSNNTLYMTSKNYAVKLNQNDYLNMYQMKWYDLSMSNHIYEQLKSILHITDESINVQATLINLLLKVIIYTVYHDYHFDYIQINKIGIYDKIADNEIKSNINVDLNKPNIVDLFMPYKFEGYKTDIMQSKCNIELVLYKRIDNDSFSFHNNISFNLKGEIIDSQTYTFPRQINIFYKLVNDDKIIDNCIKAVIDKILEFRLNINHLYQEYIDSEIKIPYTGDFNLFLTEFKFHMLDTFKDLDRVKLINIITKESIKKTTDIKELISEINALSMRTDYDDF